MSEKETSAEFIKRVGMDGKLWADELNKMYPAIPLDEALGWCCNMIMAGFDEAQRRTRRTDDRVSKLVEAAQAALDGGVFKHPQIKRVI